MNQQPPQLPAQRAQVIDGQNAKSRHQHSQQQQQQQRYEKTWAGEYVGGQNHQKRAGADKTSRSKRKGKEKFKRKSGNEPDGDHAPKKPRRNDDSNDDDSEEESSNESGGNDESEKENPGMGSGIPPVAFSSGQNDDTQTDTLLIPMTQSDMFNDEIIN